MLKNIGLFLVIFLFPTCTWGATYTVCAAGCDETDIASAIASATTAGDIVEIHSGTYRETITLGSSGSVGNEIIVRGKAGDTAYVYGSDLDDGSSGWNDDDSNGEYEKLFATEPHIVINSATDVILENGTKDGLGATEWDYSGTTLYTGFNPATTNIEVGQRIGLDTNDNDYVSVSNLYFRYCQGTDGASLNGTVNIEDTSTNITIDSCNIQKNQRHGIAVKGGTSFTISNNTIDYQWSRTVDDVGSADGIYVQNGTSSPTGSITGNTIGSNTADTIHRMGIAIVDGDAISITNNNIYGGRTGIDIEPNTGQETAGGTITGNTIDKPANTDNRGGSDLHKGISVLELAGGDVTGTWTISNNTIDLQDEAMNGDYDGFMYYDLDNDCTINQSNNTIRDVGDGVVVSGCSAVITIDGDKYTAGSTQGRFGILFPATADKQSLNVQVQNCLIIDFPYGMDLNETDGSEVDFYHNTLYLDGSQVGVRIDDDVAENDLELKNNIFGYTPQAAKYYVWKVNANSTLDADYNLYLNTAAGDWWAYEGAGRTWTEWTVTESMDSNGVNSNPLFISAGSANFQLQLTSPAIDTGTDVSVTTDYGGKDRDTPEIGAYEFAKPPLWGVSITGGGVN